MIPRENIYWTEEITTMLRLYALKDFSEKNHVLKVDDCGITPIEKFSRTTTDISLKNHHTWGCSVYILDSRSQGNIDGLSKYKTRSHAGIYIGN